VFPAIYSTWQKKDKNWPSTLFTTSIADGKARVPRAAAASNRVAVILLQLLNMIKQQAVGPPNSISSGEQGR